MQVDINFIKKEARKELSRRDFFSFCNILHPKDYKKNRNHLVDLCNSMQEFYNSTDDVLIINLPP